MNELKYKEYTIQFEDTLESIAEKHELSPSQLRKYHNLHCELSQLIGPELEGRNKIIFIPLGVTKEETDTWVKNEKRVLKNKDGSLTMRPIEGIKTYTYALSMQHNEVLNTMDTTMDIGVIAEKDDHWIYQISRRWPIYINKETAYRKIDILSLMISQMLYPLELVVNKKGEILDIYNYESIKKRIPSTIYKIYEEFEPGEIVDTKVRLLTENIEDKDWILNNLKSDLFLKNYFSGIYELPADESGISKWIDSYPVVLGELVDFDFEHRVMPKTSNENYVHLERHGTVIPFPEGIDLDGVPQKSGDFRAHYYLHPITNQIEILRLHYTFNQEKFINVLVEIQAVEKMKIPHKEMENTIIKEEL